MAKINLSSKTVFGIGPYLADIAHDGNNVDRPTEGYYWDHIRRPLLKKLRKGAVVCAPNVETFADDPEGAMRECYEALILDTIHTLGDELGCLVVMVRDTR